MAKKPKKTKPAPKVRTRVSIKVADLSLDGQSLGSGSYERTVMDDGTFQERHGGLVGHLLAAAMASGGWGGPEADAKAAK